MGSRTGVTDVVRSPFTGTRDVNPLCRFERSITSDSRYVDGPTSNYVCLDTGIIFNADGARAQTAAFYREQYRLHQESPESEFLHFENDTASGCFERMVAIIEENSSLPPAGHVLDIGCGKGLLLKRFLDRHPAWRAYGVEPSENARRLLARVLPDVTLYGGAFESSPLTGRTFDVVTASGVLEHVAHPLTFLRIIRTCLGPDGVALIDTPNFGNNAADLFTYDHLSRLTPATIRWLFSTTGLSPIAIDAPADRVSMSFLLRPGVVSAAGAAEPGIVEESLSTAQAATAWIDHVFSEYAEAARAAREAGTRAAFYGAGTIGLMATRCTALSREVVYAIYDDNQTFWDSEREGIPIRNPSRILEDGVGVLAISANACYWPAIRRRIASLTSGRVAVFPRS